MLNAHAVLRSRGDKAMRKCHLDILLWLVIAILDARASLESVSELERLLGHSILAAGLVTVFFKKKLFLYLAVPGLHCDVGILSCRMWYLVP